MTTMMLPTTATTTAPAAPHHDHPGNHDTLLPDEKDWCKAVNTLAKFASIDTMEYASLLVATRKNERHARHAQQPNYESTERSKEHRALMLQLEALRRNNAFRETPIPDLVQAIHRFHSNLALWHHQDAQHAQEMRNLQTALAASQDREEELRQQCKTLHQQTAKLRSKLKEKRSVLAHVKTWYRTSLAERESLQELATAAQLQVHEHVMAAPGRIRLGSTETTDSNFSDGLNFMDNDYTSTHNEGAEGDFTHTEETAEGSESQSSLVTDEGVATLLFKPDESLPRIAATSSTYSLEFASGMKTGMRVKAVPLSDWVPSSKPALSPVHLEGGEAICSSASNDDQDDLLDDTTTEGFAFVVCGHHKYSCSDDETNGKVSRKAALPPVGARILAVRNQKILPTWDISEVLDTMSSTEDGKSTFTVTFRNGRVKTKQGKGSGVSDDDSSSQEGQNSESLPEKSSQRPFGLLQFGKNASIKTKGAEKEAADQKEQAKPAPQKGNNNPLMFWRSEDKSNVGEQNQPDGLPLGESGQDETMEDARKSSPEAEEESSKTELCTFDGAVEGQDEALASLKENDTDPKTDARSRKNTADSLANTEATAMSKEDPSIASCSEQKSDGYNATAEEADAESAPTLNKSKPMNHLMFWRKSEPTQGGNTHNDTDEPPAEDADKKPSEDVKEEKSVPTENSGFRMPFWNALSRQNQTTTSADATGPSVNGRDDLATSNAAEEKNNTEDVTQTANQANESNEATTVQQLETDNETPTADATLLDAETKQNSARETEVAAEEDEEGMDGPVRDVVHGIQTVQKPKGDIASETIERESSAEQSTQHAEEGTHPPTAQNGPSALSRFFSNPFAKAKDSDL